MKKLVIILPIIGMGIGSWIIVKGKEKIITKFKFMSNKHLALFLMMNRWVNVKQRGKSLASYFQKRGYEKIAIYGMNYAGKTLLNELKNTEVMVAYGIDKNADSMCIDVDIDIDIVSMEDSWERVDAIVVTAITFFDEIVEQFSNKIDCPIISLEDILYEV